MAGADGLKEKGTGAAGGRGRTGTSPPGPLSHRTPFHRERGKFRDSAKKVCGRVKDSAPVFRLLMGHESPFAFHPRDERVAPTPRIVTRNGAPLRGADSAALTRWP